MSRDEDDSKVSCKITNECQTVFLIGNFLKCTSPGECNDDETKIGMDLKEEEILENYKVRLRKELVSRDGHSEIEKDTTRFLTFKDKNLEKAYGVYREPFSSIPLTASLLVQMVGVFYSLFVLPR